MKSMKLVKNENNYFAFRMEWVNEWVNALSFSFHDILEFRVQNFGF